MEFTTQERIVIEKALVLRKRLVNDMFECTKDDLEINEFYKKELDTINELLEKI